jgi:hypothetical protein
MFRGEPNRQDLVELEAGADERSHDDTWIGRLLAVVAVMLPGQDETKELVLVRYFKADPAGGIAALPGVRVLVDEKDGVAEARHVRRRVLLHPHPSRQGSWLFNHFV